MVHIFMLKILQVFTHDGRHITLLVHAICWRLYCDSKTIKPTIARTAAEQRLAKIMAVSSNMTECRPQTSGLQDDDLVHRVICVRKADAHTPPSANQLNRCMTCDHEPAVNSKPNTCNTQTYTCNTQTYTCNTQTYTCNTPVSYTHLTLPTNREV